jgi:hypothetical protein
MDTESKLKRNDDSEECIIPGAETVLVNLFAEYRNDYTKLLLLMEKNSIRGSKIWTIYKDACECEIRKFYDYITTRACHQFG